MGKGFDYRMDYLIPAIEFDDTIISKGSGSYIYDNSGQKYLDINSGQFCAILGHANLYISKKIAESLYSIQHTSTSMVTESTLEAAANLNKISQEMDSRSIFLNTGGEAIEFCLRYAKHIKSKDGVICFNKGYHGLSLGAQSITYAGRYTLPHVPLTFSTSIPDTLADEYAVQECINEFESILIRYQSDIAVAVFEPIVSVGGMIIPPQSYFKNIRKLCDKYDILLAFDECQTGFGRTGKWFYYQEIECVPDIVVCAKGIGLGYPVSIVMFKKDIIPEDGFKMTHFSSHQNDPFLCDIVNIGINYIENNRILKKVIKIGNYFLSKLNELSKQCKSLVHPRGKGLMLGIDIEINGISNYRSLYKKEYIEAKKNGLILQATNEGKTLRFLPNYLVSKEEIDFCIKILYDIFVKYD